MGAEQSWLLFIVLPRLARHEGLHDTPVLTQQVRQERGKDVNYIGYKKQHTDLCAAEKSNRHRYWTG